MGQRTDVILLSPAQMVTADMVPDNVGTWMYHCHVSEHGGWDDGDVPGSAVAGIVCAVQRTTRVGTRSMIPLLLCKRKRDRTCLHGGRGNIVGPSGHAPLEALRAQRSGRITDIDQLKKSSSRNGFFRSCICANKAMAKRRVQTSTNGPLQRTR